MCTSFVSNFNRPLYGMNFDYPKTELKIAIDNHDGNSYFIMSFKAGDIFVNTVGMNSNGVFVSLQMLPDDNSEIIESSPNNLPAMLLFFEVLKNARTLEDALKMLDEKRFVVLRRPKGHCLIGNLTGSSVIIEEGKEDNEIIKHEKFAVMTNFKNSVFKNMKVGVQ